ncbi:prostaglandin G/H synthase 1-like [Acyrthosiphon pisum]|uniref:prostaglandin-endoperoxide synthase n=1 Tax=Acyrthosiphon pisum TaxID=7029 RepID=A0A8R2JR64_ACYPI|nr:prostaglandin G/H synthase 1-like [Acyrthosiphon pisum]
MYSKENGLSCWCTQNYVGEHCLHQNSVKRLENVFAGSNNGGYGPRILPSACPLECCANDKTSPPLGKLYNKVLKRKPGQLIPDRKNRNLLLDAFYQYFVLQFFDANSNLTVTASQLYGSDDMSERSMRSFSGGKLKTSAINYKPFATNHALAPYSDVYLTALTKDISIDRSWPSRMNARLSERAEMLSTGTMFYVMSLLWAREHNWMCAELSQKWPTWTDEELYIKARKIVTRQMMNIMMTEIQNVELRQEGYHHRMEYIRGSGNPFELHLTMAVSNVPEKLQCSSTNLTSYSNASQVSEAALNDSIQVMMSSKINVVTVNDDSTLTEQLTMTLSREQCLQRFNNYRRRIGLPAYKNFFDITVNVEAPTEFEKLYSTMEKVELLTVVLTEKSISGVLPTEGTCVREFTIFLMLSVVVVHLECSKIVHQNSVKRLENVFAGSNNGGYGPRILPPACPLERCANDSFRM